MARKVLWILMAVLAIVIGLYPAIYFFNDGKFGILGSKPDELLADRLWHLGFFTHIVLGGVALLTGWTQFSQNWRNRYLALHRRIGMIYVIAVVLSSIAGIFIAFHATGGIIPSIGFMCLGIAWFSFTTSAYFNIRNKSIIGHEKMMIYSYAACLAAVTLRIWLPILIIIFNDFIKAYTIVAWLCWVPNLLVAYLIVRRRFKEPAFSVGS